MKTLITSVAAFRNNILCLCACCFWGIPLPAQQLKLNKILSLQTVPGLENILVDRGAVILEDHLGYVWVAYQDGLYKFDGYKTIHYAFDPNQPDKLAGNLLMGLAEDDIGNIWFGVFGIGLQKLNPATGQFTLYKPHPSNPDSLNINLIQSIKFNKGKLWIQGQGANLCAFLPKTGKFKTYSKGIYQSIIQNNGILWTLDTSRILSYYDSQSDSIVRFDSLKTASYFFLRLAINDKIYLSNYGDRLLYVYEIKSKKLGCLEPNRKGDEIYDIINLDNGQLLIARKNKKFEFYNTEKGIFYTSPVNAQIIQNNFFVFDFFKLRKGDLWFLGDKIYKAISNDKGIESFELIQNDKKINIGAPSLLSQWTPNNLSIGMSFLLDFNNNKAVKTSSKFPVLSKFDSAYRFVNQYVNVYTDENKDCWISLFELSPLRQSLYKFSNSNKKLEKIGVFTNLKDVNAILAITKIGEDIWLAGWTGLLKWHIPTSKGTHYNYKDGKDSTQLSSNNLRFVFKDKDDDLWIASQNGLNLKKKNQAYFTHYLAHAGDTNALSFNSVSTINQDASGIIWIGTQGGGVNTFDKKTGKFSWITSKQGLADNAIENILIDDFQDVWVSHRLGISKISAKTMKIQNFTQADGIQKFLFENSSVKMADGSLIFGIDGFNRIFPSKIKPDTFQPPLLITNFKLFNKDVSINGADSILHQHINITHSLALKHYQNVITLEYAALDMAHPAQVSYAYQLVGFDPDWQYVDNKREVTYTNLPSGHYTFKVQSTHNEGVWHEMEHPLSITIHPPWWRTWWAYVLYALAFVYALRTYIHYRSRQLKDENIVLEEKVHQRTNELEKSLEDLKATQTQLIQKEKLASLGELTAGIAHEIQNPLNFVNNFSELSVDLTKELNEELDKPDVDKPYIKEILGDLTSNQEKINHHGKRASSIVKGMLEHSRASTGVRELTDINKLADEYLRLSYHGLRAKDKEFNADFELIVDPNLPKIEVIPQDIGRVLLNLINNAFYAVNEKSKKNTEGVAYQPTVIFSTQKIDNQIIIKVKDNGTGMPESVRAKVFQPFFTTKPTGQGTGLGLSLAYDIVTKGHGGELKVESKEDEFTEFIIKLPF